MPHSPTALRTGDQHAGEFTADDALTAAARAVNGGQHSAGVAAALEQVAAAHDALRAAATADLAQLLRTALPTAAAVRFYASFWEGPDLNAVAVLDTVGAAWTSDPDVGAEACEETADALYALVDLPDPLRGWVSTLSGSDPEVLVLAAAGEPLSGPRVVNEQTAAALRAVADQVPTLAGCLPAARRARAASVAAYERAERRGATCGPSGLDLAMVAQPEHADRIVALWQSSDDGYEVGTGPLFAALTSLWHLLGTPSGDRAEIVLPPAA